VPAQRVCEIALARLRSCTTGASPSVKAGGFPGWCEHGARMSRSVEFHGGVHCRELSGIVKGQGRVPGTPNGMVHPSGPLSQNGDGRPRDRNVQRQRSMIEAREEELLSEVRTPLQRRPNSPKTTARLGGTFHSCESTHRIPLNPSNCVHLKFTQMF
jgi:hypothetical protein